VNEATRQYRPAVMSRTGSSSILLWATLKMLSNRQQRNFNCRGRRKAGRVMWRIRADLEIR
jgi:hypothetical protein